jgi:hypothetical protein
MWDDSAELSVVYWGVFLRDDFCDLVSVVRRFDIDKFIFFMYFRF